jgi:hypothetical protein
MIIRNNNDGYDDLMQRKLIDWKKTKLFGFRWNWDEEKKLRGIRLQIFSLSPRLFMQTMTLLQS